MDGVTVRCHAELNDFLPRERRYTTFTVPYTSRESIKNLVESVGVPHPEITTLLVNGTPVDFSYLVQPGDQIEVAPISVRLATDPIPLRPPLTTFHFVLDAHLGRLAAYLRMLGFDTLYRNDYDDPELAQLAHAEARILLTRDIGLLKRSIVTYGYFVRATMAEQQLREVVQRFNLRHEIASFQRCTRCNGQVRPVEKAAIDHLLEPKTRLYYNEFHQCASCRKIYWQGSHYERMHSVIERVLHVDTRGGSSHGDAATREV